MSVLLVQRVATMLRQRGERMTTPRREVLRVLESNPRHVTAEEVADQVAEGVHLASVYRTLEAFTSLGVVQHVHLGKGGTAYHLVGEQGPHVHAQCTSCGRLVDLPTSTLDDVARRVATSTGFLLDPAHVALAGTCAGCSDGTSPGSTR